MPKRKMTKKQLEDEVSTKRTKKRKKRLKGLKEGKVPPPNPTYK